MTTATPAEIEPRSDLGSGLILAISKAASHISLIPFALARDITLSPTDIGTELDDASRHLDQIVTPSDLLTVAANDRINDWRLHIAGCLEELRGRTRENDELSDADRTLVRDIVEDTWQLLAVLDLELAGVVADPGRLP